MSNLVKRLRGEYELGENGEHGTRSFASFIPPISLEAANKIEELQAENERLKSVLLAEYTDQFMRAFGFGADKKEAARRAKAKLESLTAEDIEG